MKKKFFAALLLIGLLAGCAPKQAGISSAVLATLKTQSIALSETAFLIDYGRGRYRLQVYAAGQLAYDLEVGTMVCVQGRCMDRREFNARHLSGWYPQTLLLDVLAGRPVYNLEGASLEPTPEGFIQRAHRVDRYQIHYERAGDNVRFIDSLNKITIAIKRI